MAQAPSDRSHTQALEALIRRTVAELRRTPGRHTSDAVLFLGNAHRAFPSLLVLDPVLEPVDKLVWMVIGQHGQDAGMGAAFPRYPEIARRANIASTSTVSRAIAILRATRWLSLCARVRDGNGRFRGNVYALHDEPLSLTDTLQLDAEYMAFLKTADRHHHARVRRVAAAVLASLDEDIAAGRDLLAPTNPIERRLEAWAAWRQAGGRYFSFSATVLSSLGNRRSDRSRVDRDQNSKPDRLRFSSAQKSKAVLSSSSYKNIKTTTTTPTTKTPQNSTPLSPDESLMFPERLTGNQRGVAARYLADLPAAQRQSVLDELEGRLRAERRGARPVYDELQYLHRLCQRVKAGRFQPNLGLKVQAERGCGVDETKRRREEAVEQAPSSCPSLTPPKQRQGESPLAEARRILGLPPRRPDSTS